MAHESPKYDVGRYQEAFQKVGNSARKIENLPQEYQKKVRILMMQAVQGTLDACREIYEPDLENITRAGSDTDYETDKKGLQDLVNFFE